MKMRIQGNAIRLRLNRLEVNEFESVGKVEAAVSFPGGRRLRYLIERGGGGGVVAEFDGDSIRISVPARIARDWTGTGQVGIHECLTLPGEQTLEIAIEKDFQCMHKGEGGKDPDAYPNPMATQSS